jgi:integrase
LHTPTNGRLTDIAIRHWIKGKGKYAGQKTLWDGGSLYLERTKADTLKWRISYHHGDKEKVYTIGGYPSVSLGDARAERDKVKAWLREGKDPVQQRELERDRQLAKSLTTFRGAFGEWIEFERKRKKWSDIHYQKSKRAIERDVLPRLGHLPVAEIEEVTVTNMVKAILARDVIDTAKKVLHHVEGIFTYARAHGVGEDNPATPAWSVIPKNGMVRGRPALLEFEQLGDVLRRAEAANLTRPVYMAHRLLAFAPGARIENVVEAQSREFDLDREVPTWIVPRPQMKARDRHHPHKVILCPIIAEELRAWRRTTGGRGYLFRSPAGGAYISREAIEKAYRVTLGLRGKHVPHGWRAAFRTLAAENENPKFDEVALELALDHIQDNEVVRAYDRGERLAQRIKLAYWWGEQLERAHRGGDVLPLKKKAA